ncbi:hypothetical protein FIBSPDRAFT_776291 [Athelia psychrophila]|uniref:Zn(2)-C6 fungal-type domain-containing protein n=1 Tax=Athelia psychrophila TaxID=1759441 RepID=A0A166UDG9_9AGAM|nr:hypothetical protein FIBSPDRAFT_776291 [Fibularhizoctonia sp. CBS 109695]
MKRGFTNDGTSSVPSATGPRNLPQKRSKKNQSCMCKKSKTRCEVLDSDASGRNARRCHRCNALNIPCSFEEVVHDGFQRAPSGSTHSPLASASSPALVGDTLAASPSSIVGARAAPAVSDHNIERLPLPIPPNSTWNSLKRSGVVDWLDTPVYCIRTIARGSPSATGNDSMDQVDSALCKILTPRQLDSLLESFEEKFSPWLNMPRKDPRNGSTFLQLAQCLVASRFLDPPTRASIAPRLRELAEKTAGRVLFDPAPSTDSIQAIILLAMWAPVGAGLTDARDERLLIAAAVGMAVNLRLDEAIGHLLRMESATSAECPSVVDLEDVRNKARLWLCLMNGESMLCMGTGRLPLSNPSGSHSNLVDWSSGATIESGRDARLALSRRVYATAEAGLRLRFSKQADLELFYQQVVDTLSEFENIANFIIPLSAVTEHESFQAFVMQMDWRMCQLLFIQHCRAETQKVYSPGTIPPRADWHLKAVCNGVSLPITWGKQTLILAQDILASAIYRRPVTCILSTMPDSIFAMICTTAAYLVRIKISAYAFMGIRIPGSSDNLLQKIRELLTTAACGPDHISARCAQFLATLINTYEAHLQVPPQQQLQLAEQDAILSIGRDRRQQGPGTLRDDELGTGAGVATGAGMYEATNPDLMLDADFWASFMNNLVAGQM